MRVFKLALATQILDFVCVIECRDCDPLLTYFRLITGFGRTEVPKDLTGYSYKSIAIAIKELAEQLEETQIVLGYVSKPSTTPYKSHL